MECWSTLPAHFSEMAATAKIYGIDEVGFLHKCGGLEFAVVYLWNLYLQLCFFLIAVTVKILSIDREAFNFKCTFIQNCLPLSCCNLVNHCLPSIEN